MTKASTATIDNVITINGRMVVVVDILDVVASYNGKDEYFEYWKGTDGTVYAM